VFSSDRSVSRVESLSRLAQKLKPEGGDVFLINF